MNDKERENLGTEDGTYSPVTNCSCDRGLSRRRVVLAAAGTVCGEGGEFGLSTAAGQTTVEPRRRLVIQKGTTGSRKKKWTQFVET